MPYSNPEDEALDAVLDVWGCIRDRQWLAASLGCVIWTVVAIAMVIMAPFAIVAGVWTLSKKLVLKFRRKSADILRPKDVVRLGNPRPASDLVAAFVEYERLLVEGKETVKVRSKLISSLAHIEQELEEHRLLTAEIRKLRVEDERPSRRDAIMATRRRGKNRRERERREDEDRGEG